MRNEYDFKQGTRGKHAGKRARISGDRGAPKSADTEVRIQRIIERDLKSREDFNMVWNELDVTEKETIRASWLKYSPGR